MLRFDIYIKLISNFSIEVNKCICYNITTIKDYTKALNFLLEQKSGGVNNVYL